MTQGRRPKAEGGNGVQFSLGTIQRWLQAVITNADGVEAGVLSDEARGHIALEPGECELVISPSRSLNGAERLAIYHNAYFARLVECMRNIYPMLVRAIGEDAFDSLSVGYLNAFPSRSYTLDRLGDDFPRFLEETRPDRDENGQPTETWPDFLLELARLEWAIGQVFDGPGIEGRPTLTAQQLLAIDPARWPALRLLCAPCVRTMAFRFPVNDYFTALRELPPEADPPEFPTCDPTWLALSRRDFVVRRHVLQRPQLELLTALIEGETVGTAIERITSGADLNVGDLAVRLRDWFRTWTAAGFFISIRS